MTTNVQIYQSPPFKGLNETPNIQEGESPYCIGVYSDLGAIKKQSGYIKKYSKNFGNAIQGIYEYIKSSLEKWLIVVADNKVWKKAPADTDFSQLEISEDTLLSCAGNKIYKHRGISSEIDSYFEVSDTPTPNFTGLTIANNNLVSCDDAGDKIRVHSGISATITSSFASPASDPSGLYYDGTDLWSCDKGTSKIYHHSGISATITESFDSPGIAPTGLSCDNTKNLISGNYEKYGRFITKLKENASIKWIYPQLQVATDKIYYIWQAIDTGASTGKISLSKTNIDGDNWVSILDISTNTSDNYPQFQVVENKVYFVWQQTDTAPTPVYQIWTAIANTDGTNLTTTQRTSGGKDKFYPQLQVFENKVYFVWQEKDASDVYQIWTAVMNLDGTGWTATQRTSGGTYNRSCPQFQVTTDKIYFVYEENAAIWTATMNLDDTNWVATQRISSGSGMDRPQLQVATDKIYYIWSELTGGWYQIFIATTNLDGSYWNKQQITTTTGDKYKIQFQIKDNLIYLVWQDALSNADIWTGQMDTNYQNWIEKERTSTANNEYPQFQVVENKVYFVWDINQYKIYTAQIYLGTIFIHKGKSSSIEKSYITSDNIDDIYYDGTNLISCDRTAKKITIYEGISNTVKSSFTISHEPYGLSFASIVKTSNLEVDKCDFATLNDTLIITTGKKWLLRWTGSGNLISNVPTTSFQQFPVIKYCKFFKNVVIGVDINNLSRLKWCFWNMPDTWYDSSYLDIDKDNGEVIKGLSLFRDDLIVFKENYLYKVFYTGDATIPFTYDTIDNVGTVGHKTVVLVEGLLYFITKDGIYVFDGTPSKRISRLIPNTFAKFLSQHYDKIVAIDMKPLHQIWWTIPEPEVSGNATVLIYDYLLNCFWTSCQKETDYFNYFEVASNEYLAGGAKSTNAYIYKLNEGDTADDSAYLAGVYYSKRLDFGFPNKWKQVRKIFVDTKASGNYTLEVSIGVDETWTIKTIDLASSQERIVRELLYNKVGKSFQFKFRNSNANQPFIVYNWGVEYQVLPWER
ncbi:MAG: hypothetical protein AB1567_08845 [bacterium]